MDISFGVVVPYVPMFVCVCVLMLRPRNKLGDYYYFMVVDAIHPFILNDDNDDNNYTWWSTRFALVILKIFSFQIFLLSINYYSQSI